MPTQHFRCPNCGTLDLIYYRTADVDDPEKWPPICSTEECFEVRMVQEPQPGDFAIDAKEPFQRFTVDRAQMVKDAETGQWVQGQRTEVIDSVHKMREIEADSEQRYRNGEGEPMRFRMWNQDRSNKDESSFGTEGTIGDGAQARHYDSGKTPVRKRNIGVTRHGQQKPKIAVARGGGATPLPMK